jgi:hypothetical protein
MSEQQIIENDITKEQNLEQNKNEEDQNKKEEEINNENNQIPQGKILFN